MRKIKFKNNKNQLRFIFLKYKSNLFLIFIIKLLIKKKKKKI